jgi:phosphatidylcholine synthase
MSEQYSQSPLRRLLSTLPAWCVHLYTASSAVVGVWAIHATFQGEFRLAMYLMLLTIVIDATDGMWARAVDVRGKLPWFDGRRLDDICDYFTYVIVPACFLIETQLLPHPAWVALPVLASGYGFSQDKAKTDDHFFLGFPSYWNILAMYMYLMSPQPDTAMWLLIGFSAAVFFPLRFIYPSRTRVFRPVSLAMMAIWALLFSWVSVRPNPDERLLYLSLIGPGYYIGLSLLLNVPVLREAALGAGRP